MMKWKETFEGYLSAGRSPKELTLWIEKHAGSIMMSLRWKKLTKKERSEKMTRLVEKRWKKNKKK